MQIGTVSGFWFCRRSRRLKINIRWTFVHFRKPHVCAKKLDVQETDFSLTQFYRSCEIISLDACLRMDGIPALDLWDLVIEVFHSSPNQLNHTKDQVQGNLSRHQTSTPKTKPGFQHDNFDLNNVDCVPSNAKFSRFVVMLYIFEDSEAVIKMITKSRCPRMRYVSRTHRVALDWLFDRKIWTPNFVSSMSTPTKGNFTRDEWNNLLYLFDISHSSSLCCAQNFSFQLHWNDGEKDARTGRREQDRGKVKAGDDEPGLHCLDKVFDCEQSGSVEKPGNTQKHPVEQVGQVQGNLT